MSGVFFCRGVIHGLGFFIEQNRIEIEYNKIGICSCTSTVHRVHLHSPQSGYLSTEIWIELEFEELWIELEFGNVGFSFA